MSKGPQLELLITSKGRAVYTRNGRLFIGEEMTQYVKVISAATCGLRDRIALVTLDKLAVVLEDHDDGVGREIGRHQLPKRPTCVSFVSGCDLIVVSDAFGDVYKLPVMGNISLSDDESCEELCILGHYSTITDLAVSSSLVATGDRDFRIRISQWPNCFVIRSFCLGHSDVVTTLLFLGIYLLSGSADGSLRLWSLDGLCLAQMNCSEYLSSLKGNGVGDGSAKSSSDSVFITCVAAHPLDSDMVLFTVHGASSIFKVSGILEGRLRFVGIEVQCIGVVSGMAIDQTSSLWVSVENELSLYRWDISEKGSCTQTVLSLSRHASDELASDESNKDEDTDAGRFNWLLRQRKRIMVEDWKGKKRRHIEV